MIGYLFPGQGADFTQLLLDSVAQSQQIKERFESSEPLLGYSIIKTMQKDPKAFLEKTTLIQPALYILSCALYDALKVDEKPAVFAGLSLGEYAALYAGGWISYQEGLHVVHARALAMEKSSITKKGAMAALLGCTRAEIQSTVSDFSKFGSDIWIANHNAQKQIVVAGRKAVLEATKPVFIHRGVKKFIYLDVEGAFHTPYMASSEPALAQALEKISLNESKNTFISNVTGKKVPFAIDIKSMLKKQLTSTVEWVESMETMSILCDSIVAIDPSKVLSRLAKNTGCGIKTIDTFASIGT